MKLTSARVRPLLIVTAGLGIFCLLLPQLSLAAVAINNQASVPAPVLVSPGNNLVSGSNQITVKGVIKNGAKVRLYLDGRKITELAVANHPSGTANFAYQLQSPLGDHKISATSVDAQGRESANSRVVSYRVEKPLPAPTILSPQPNQTIATQKVPVVGVYKSGSIVKVYIDGKYYGEIDGLETGQLTTAGDNNGTENFNYQPLVPLKPGKHTVYTLAVDAKGKRSVLSNKVSFVVAEPQRLVLQQLAITDTTESTSSQSDTAAAQTPTTSSPSSQTAGDQTDAANTNQQNTNSDKEAAQSTANQNQAAEQTQKTAGSKNWIWVVAIITVISLIYWYFSRRTRGETTGLKLPTESKTKNEGQPEQKDLFSSEPGKKDAEKKSPDDEIPIPPPPPDL